MRQHGFSLIETLIAATVMALGLSGLAALLLKSVTETSNAGYRTTAAESGDGVIAVRCADREGFLVNARWFCHG